MRIIAKNNACNPAKGTVLICNLDFNAKNNMSEKISEVFKSTRNVAVGKLIESTMKNKISPNPIASWNFFFKTYFV